MNCIDDNKCGIALVTNEMGHLLGTITDGDIRRAILSGHSLDIPINKLLAWKTEASYPKPVTSQFGTDPHTLLHLMKEKAVRQIPLLYENGVVADLVVLDDVLPMAGPSMQAVIVAGGLGTRLRPLTEDLPKPMLPVGGRPLMELIVEQLQQAGIRQVSITTHYKPEKIIEHFGDGSSFGVVMTYVNEDQPLGTGGALGLIPKPNEPLLVINGDILTKVDFKTMFTYHQEYNAEMTVAVRIYDIQVPYGVIEMKGHQVIAVQEKPQMRFFVNAGIYLLQPSVFNFIPHGQHFNMTDLIQKLVQEKKKVVSFPIHEYWLDIGQHADYMQAQDDVENGRMPT